jgi:hypothetical protein
MVAIYYELPIVCQPPAQRNKSVEHKNTILIRINNGLPYESLIACGFCSVAAVHEELKNHEFLEIIFVY